MIYRSLHQRCGVQRSFENKHTLLLPLNYPKHTHPHATNRSTANALRACREIKGFTTGRAQGQLRNVRAARRPCQDPLLLSSACRKSGCAEREGEARERRTREGAAVIKPCQPVINTPPVKERTSHGCRRSHPGVASPGSAGTGSRAQSTDPPAVRLGPTPSSSTIATFRPVEK
jgi:hypothetical protein